MARLRQSLTGVQGLEVLHSEYVEEKKILNAKYGGQRRQLQAHTHQLETKFSDKKLQARGRQSELGAGTFHSLLVTKLTDKQPESYKISGPKF